MKKMLGKILFGTAVMLATAVAASYAQTAGDQDKGSSGWSGGAKDQPSQNAPKGTQGDPGTTTGQKVEAHDEGEAKTQPEMATGEDLKGPPQQFAPSKTPE